MIYTIDILSDPDEKKMHNHDLKRIYITLYVENLKDLYWKLNGKSPISPQLIHSLNMSSLIDHTLLQFAFSSVACNSPTAAALSTFFLVNHAPQQPGAEWIDYKI